MKTFLIVFSQLRAGTLDLKTAFWGFKVIGSILIFSVIIFISENLIFFYVLIDAYLLYKVMKCAVNYHQVMGKKKRSSTFGFVVQGLLVANGFVLVGLLNASF